MQDFMDALDRRMKKLHGIQDARGPIGIAARGPAMYPGGAVTGNIGPVGTGLMAEHTVRKMKGQR